MSQVTAQQVKQDFIEVLTKLVDVDPAKVQDSDRLREDLGLDSLQSMELLSRISDKYELDLDVEDVMDVQTVGDVVAQLVEFVQTGRVQ